jgi:hypothetical protein
LYESIISPRGELWNNKTSLTLSLFIEVSVPSQESDWSCIYVVGVSILPFSMIFQLNFRTDSGISFFFILLLVNVPHHMGRHGRDRMEVGFTTTYAISAYHN